MTGWVMVQLNEGELSYTAHPTEEDAYKDIVETVIGDWSWVGYDEEDDADEIKFITQMFEGLRPGSALTAKSIFNGHLKGRFDPVNGFNMWVALLNNIDSLAPILVNIGEE